MSPFSAKFGWRQFSQGYKESKGIETVKFITWDEINQIPADQAIIYATPTPIHVYNTTAVGIVNNTIKCQQSHAMEMRYFWLLDQYWQKYLDISHQLKHHTGIVTQHVHPYYIHESTSTTLLSRAMVPSAWRGCAEILGDTYRRQVALPRITNKRVQDSTQDPAHPYLQNFGPYVQTKIGQQKPEQPFVQLQQRTDVINSYTNIRT